MTEFIKAGAWDVDDAQGEMIKAFMKDNNLK
jgi:hypothetical protein